MIITTVQQLIDNTHGWDHIIACDTETHPDKLLGISISNGKEAHYVPIHHWNKEKKQWECPSDRSLVDGMGMFLMDHALIGHNFTYDKNWLDRYYNISTVWMCDTRIMWHLSSAPSGPFSYGLKDAQVELLGWNTKGDVELKHNVEQHGGKLKDGDHYLADLDVLSKYAELDALSTYQVFNKLCPFFLEHDYTWMMDLMMEYNLLLDENTRSGVLVNREGMEKAHEQLLKKKEAAKKRFLKELQEPISSLEQDWADRKIASYKRQYNKDRYRTHPEEWQRFNLNSDKDKRELFYDKLRNDVLYTTDSGRASVNGDAIKQMKGAFVESYLKYEKANTITSNFSSSYLKLSAVDSRLHPGFNVCGTVSYRLSGFKPYLLNAPFDERLIMKNLLCDPGYIGVHADLSAIEPTITAHYSDDPALVKVFRDGLGDIYLDLAKELFPNDKELQEGYDPNVPITKAIKERFSKQRKVSKVIQLAVQYTGTGHTVSKNLTKDGIPTTKEEADGYVRAYWSKFRKVKEFNYRLKETNKKQGHLRNVIGRIIRVPDVEYKDLSNRFIQSSAHDILVLWVLEIYRRAKEEGIPIRPILLDCHDSTSNQVPLAHLESTKRIYAESLHSINEQLGLSVTVRAEVKTFNTLAGLKGDE